MEADRQSSTEAQCDTSSQAASPEEKSSRNESSDCSDASESPPTKTPRRGRKRRLSKARGGGRSKRQAPQSETLWDIVRKNVRKNEEPGGDQLVPTCAKPRGPTLSTSPDDLSLLLCGGDGLTNDDPLSFLFGGNSSAQTHGSVSTSNRAAEPLLSLDDHNNFLLAEAPSHRNRARDAPVDYRDLLEGTNTEVVTLGYDSQVQPYDGAYKKTKPVKWTAKDTKRFYESLEVFGSDLMLVKTMLPQFTNRQIQNKFKIEDKKNPEKVSLSLARQAATRNASKMLQEFEQSQGEASEFDVMRFSSGDMNGDLFGKSSGCLGDDILNALSTISAPEEDNQAEEPLDEQARDTIDALLW
eukprot:Selendium_serpulae@DN4171_c0_g1_i1.p1